MPEKDMFLLGLIATLGAAVELLIETHPQRQSLLAEFETTLAIYRAALEGDKPDPEFAKGVAALAKQLREVGRRPRA